MVNRWIRAGLRAEDYEEITTPLAEARVALSRSTAAVNGRRPQVKVLFVDRMIRLRDALDVIEREMREEIDEEVRACSKA